MRFVSNQSALTSARPAARKGRWLIIHDVTIGAVLVVKDDLDLIRASLAYHRAAGVDYFLLSSRNSTPESLDALEDLARSDDVHLLEVDLYAKPVISQEDMRRARLSPFQAIRRVFSPDWLLMADSDEFWVPRTSNLRDCVRNREADLVHVPRYNAALAHEARPVAYSDADVFELPDLLAQPVVTATADLTTRAGAALELPWIRHRVMGRFLIRSESLDAVDAVLPGAHDVDSPFELVTEQAEDLLVVHFPFTTLERFSRKIRDIGFHLERVGEHCQARHWRQWAELTDDEAKRREFLDQFFSADELKRPAAEPICTRVRDLLDLPADAEPEELQPAPALLNARLRAG